MVYKKLTCFFVIEQLVSEWRNSLGACNMNIVNVRDGMSHEMQINSSYASLKLQGKSKGRHIWIERSLCWHANCCLSHRQRGLI